MYFFILVAIYVLSADNVLKDTTRLFNLAEGVQLARITDLTEEQRLQSDFIGKVHPFLDLYVILL